MPPSFKDRAEKKGIYARLIPIISKSQDALCNLNTSTDLHASLSGLWGKKLNNKTTHFKGAHSNKDLVINIFGEMLGRSGGTAIGALGGSNPKEGQIIDDSIATSIRDVLALDAPTDAPSALIELYRDQVGTLNEIFDLDIGFSNSPKRDWIRAIPEHDENQVISIVLPYKYRIPRGSGKRVVKRSKKNDDMDVADSVKHESKESESKPTMESTYPPDRLMDFDPNLLRLAEAKLAQQPLQDPKGNYIVPWLAPEALRQGTLVNVEAKLVVHHFNVENDPSSTYQIVASRVKILAESPIPFQPDTSSTIQPAQSSSQPSSSQIVERGLFDELSETIEDANNSSDFEVLTTLGGSHKRSHYD